MRIRYLTLVVLLLISSSVATAQTTATDFFNRALTRDTQKDYDGAIADYTKAIELEPRMIGAYNNRGNLRANKGDYDGAVADYTKAIELDGNDARYYYNRALGRHKLDSYDAAIADFTRAIELDPRDIRAYWGRANSRAMKGDRNGAIADYTKVLELDPRHIQAYFQRSANRLQNKDLDGAIADLTRVIEIDPKHAGAYRSRGNQRASKKDFDGAVADYTKELELDPGNVYVLKERATAYLKLGKTDLAAADQKKATEIEEVTMYWGDLFHRGNDRFAQKDFDGAIADYTRAVALQPRRIVFYHYRARARYAKRDFDGAIADTTQAITDRYAQYDTYLVRGKARYAKKDIDGAIEDYTALIEFAAKRIPALEKQAADAKLKNDLRDAELSLSLANEIRAANTVAYYYRGLANAAKGNSDLAAADYAKALALDPAGLDVTPAWDALYRNDAADAHRIAAIFLELNGLKGSSAPYAVMVGYLGLRKSGKPVPAKAFLNKWLKQVETAAWTTQILRFMSGQLTAPQLLALAVDNNSLTQAHAYIGAIQLLNREGGVLHFEWVRDNGKKDSYEYDLSLAELGRIEAAPKTVPKAVPRTKRNPAK